MQVKIALAGNPNCGKTTLFNDLTGSSQYVGNWPGVTVEKKEGRLKGHKEVTVTDLPGIYSLSPYSPEEIVTREYLVNGGPDVIINIVDATNLERNLYLTTQILEIGLPTVVALNMMDVVRKRGDKIDLDQLSAALGCPVVGIAAVKGEGSPELVQEVLAQARLSAEKDAKTLPAPVFSKKLENALAEIMQMPAVAAQSQRARWYAVKLLEHDSVAAALVTLAPADAECLRQLAAALKQRAVTTVKV
jgi:ferrous iron transport protein B